MKNIFIALIIIATAAGIWFAWNDVLPQEDGRVWVSVDPVQCNGNPWQGDSEPQLEGPDESSVITAFYGAQGIEIFAVQSEQVHEIVCQACSCPRGDRLYFQVSEEDANVLVRQGFVITAR